MQNYSDNKRNYISYQYRNFESAVKNPEYKIINSSSKDAEYEIDYGFFINKLFN